MNHETDECREYWPYPKAMHVLEERHGATPAELAVWVMFGPGPDLGGIAAYLNANELTNPPRLEFDVMSEYGFDYLAPLMGAWFRATDIESFRPTHRYIEYPALVDRWGALRHVSNVETFIKFKVDEGRLAEIHPVAGHSELLSSSERYASPPKESTLFDLADVETIEKDDGLLGVEPNETAEMRRARLRSWYEQEITSRERGALTRTARREGISRQTLAAILDREQRNR